MSNLILASTAVAELPLTEKMTLLALQVGLILFAAKLGGMLAVRVKLPSVLGELAAGIVIGPWALGGIGFGSGLFQYGLFRGAELRAVAAATGSSPFAVTPELYGLCTIASVVLLFLSGIETNLKMFLRFAFAGSLVGIGGVVASFLFGDLCAVYLLPKFLPATFGHLADLPTLQAILSPAAMFMGIMSTATSVGITARILSERRKMDTEEGVTIMAGAVIDDVLGIIVLAIGMGIIAASGKAEAGSSVNWLGIGKVAANAFGVWLGGTVIGILLARRISWLLKFFRSPVAIATLAFGLSLVVAGLFESMGLTLIIGAYVMGLALSRTDLKHLIQENLQSVYTFLVPVFFCVMGMMVDVSALCSKPVLIFGAIYTVLAVAAKVVGCAIPSLFCGFNTLGALRVGAGMIPRGEVALIVAGIGVSTVVDGKPILSQEVFGIGILMTLVTTVVAPPCLVALFSTNRPAVRGRRSPSRETSRPFSFVLTSENVAQMMLERLISTFRDEGFFTFLLNADEHIWSVMLNDAEISVRREGRKICFESTPDEEALVMGVWLDVVGQMRSVAEELSQPVRQDEVGEFMRNEAMHDDGSPRMPKKRLRDYLMLPALTASTKQEAIEKMVDAIAAESPDAISDAGEVKRTILARERAMSSGLDHGIAVPHCKTDAVTRIVGAVAIVAEREDGVPAIADYETFDHTPVRIIVLTVAPKNYNAPYLQLMASLSRILHASSAYRRLLMCTSAESMKDFFSSKQKEKTT